MKLWAILTMVLLTTSYSADNKDGYYKGNELPNYAVSEKQGNIEIRQYQPQLVAEVTVEGTRDDAIGDGFRILANYIFGDNESNKNVEMTTPVAQKPASEKIAMTTPVAQLPDGNKWVVQFGMPKQYSLETLPVTKDERIRFKVMQAKQVASIQFSGRWSDAAFEKNKATLEKFMQERNLAATAKPSFAYYDSPFTLPWNRRNEIIIEVK